MPNYILNQRHKMACGAVALVNIFKHLGNFVASYKTVIELRDAGFWDEEDGTDYKILSKCLDIHEMPHKKHKFSHEKLSEILKAGAVALVFVEYDEYCHVFAVVGEAENKYAAPNNGITKGLYCEKNKLVGSWIWEIC